MSLGGGLKLDRLALILIAGISMVVWKLLVTWKFPEFCYILKIHPGKDSTQYNLQHDDCSGPFQWLPSTQCPACQVDGSCHDVKTEFLGGSAIRGRANSSISSGCIPRIVAALYLNLLLICFPTMLGILQACRFHRGSHRNFAVDSKRPWPGRRTSLTTIATRWDGSIGWFSRTCEETTI